MLAGRHRAAGLLRLVARRPGAARDFNVQATMPSEAEAMNGEAKWRWLAARGLDVNPCNSRLHPAVVAGIKPSGELISVQDAYTPTSKCFGCGPANASGLQLKSIRTERGLEGSVTVPDRFLAFPGVISGGVVSSIMECHGNWTAALELMDKACLPRPPLTLTASMFVNYKRPTPANQPLLVRSQVVRIIDTGTIGLTKQAVEVDLQLFAVSGSRKEVLATAEGLFKRQGATRAL